jgi:type VI secretion system protein ImpA
MAADGTELTSAPAVIDIEALLAPIEGDNPAGRPMQYDGVYDEIREARRTEENLAQGDWQRDTKSADYYKVVELASGVIAKDTKDLQVAAWLAEAVTQLHGFTGLRDSLKLMKGLQENFWDQLYPEADEGDLEARGNAISWLEKQLSEIMRRVALTNSPAGTNLNLIQYEESRLFDIPENMGSLDADQLAKIEEKRAQAIEEKKTTSEDWRKAQNASKRAYYEGLNRTIQECWTEFTALDKVMDEKFDRQTPGMGELKKTMDAIRDLMTKVIKRKREEEPDPSDMAEEGEVGSVGGSGESGRGGFTGPVRSRQDALRKLMEVADYFRVAEPHSPVAYLVQRAVKWGQMPLESWLTEVVKDEAVLAQLRETLGMNATAEAGSGAGGEWGQ